MTQISKSLPWHFIACLAFLSLLVACQHAPFPSPSPEALKEEAANLCDSPTRTATPTATPAMIFVLDGSRMDDWEGVEKLSDQDRDLGRFQGRAEVVRIGCLRFARSPTRRLSAEAEWVISMPDGGPFSESFDLDTQIRIQGMIEGKNFDVFASGSVDWGKASLGNNVVASGPGKITTLRLLRYEDLEIQVQYIDDAGRVQAFRSSTQDIIDYLSIETIEKIVRAISKGHPGSIHYIDLSAQGSSSAFVNELARQTRGVLDTLSDPSNIFCCLSQKALLSISKDIVYNREFSNQRDFIYIQVMNNKHAPPISIGSGVVYFSGGS